MMRRLDFPKTAQQLADFIRTTVEGAGFSQVAINVSGGVDSATSTVLAVRALGPENVHTLLLPYGDWQPEAGERARRMLDQLQIPAKNIHAVDIAPLAAPFLQALDLQPKEDSADLVRIGNIMARVRMIIVFDHAKRLNALVLGTENESEHFLGYYTRFGDEASDIEPLRGLYKTEVFQLAEHLGVPREIFTATPTAGLWIGQTDEGEFGFSYQEADEILYGWHDLGLSSEELIRQGLEGSSIERVRSWVKGMEFKSHLPYLGPEPVAVDRW